MTEMNREVSLHVLTGIADLDIVIIVGGKNTRLHGHHTFLGHAEAPIDLKPEWVAKSFNHAR